MILIMSGDLPVGRVSPRPQNRGRSCILLGRELLREAKALGLTVRWSPMILRSRRDAPYLRGSPGRHGGQKCRRISHASPEQ